MEDDKHNTTNTTLQMQRYEHNVTNTMSQTHHGKLKGTKQLDKHNVTNGVLKM